MSRACLASPRHGTCEQHARITHTNIEMAWCVCTCISTEARLNSEKRALHIHGQSNRPQFVYWEVHFYNALPQGRASSIIATSSWHGEISSLRNHGDTDRAHKVVRPPGGLDSTQTYLLCFGDDLWLMLIISRLGYTATSNGILDNGRCRILGLMMGRDWLAARMCCKWVLHANLDTQCFCYFSVRSISWGVPSRGLIKVNNAYITRCMWAVYGYATPGDQLLSVMET